MRYPYVHPDLFRHQQSCSTADLVRRCVSAARAASLPESEIDRFVAEARGDYDRVWAVCSEWFRLDETAGYDPLFAALSHAAAIAKDQGEPEIADAIRGLMLQTV